MIGVARSKAQVDGFWRRMDEKLRKRRAVTVEKGIPLPPRPRTTAPTKYPWRTMEVGDSFFTDVARTTIISAMYFAGQRTGRKFARRTVTENGIQGTRVWRTA